MPTGHTKKCLPTAMLSTLTTCSYAGEIRFLRPSVVYLDLSSPSPSPLAAFKVCNSSATILVSSPRSSRS